MADVRLTATNPEDSSVVPVACNAKGELLLEEPTLASDDYVAKTGDTMTGNLLLTDKITLDASGGSAEFASGDINLNADGSIQNKFYIQSFGDTDNFATINQGVITCKTDGTEPPIKVVNGDTDKATAQLSKDGIFALGTDTSAGVTTKLSLNGTDGGATFAGDVVVGSRNKQWMLVESNGLCHMVEQTSASTADLVASTPDLVAPTADLVGRAGKYPPLRDVFAELNAIEKALGEVMEKLRMTPPAGWEVWDGSSENS